MTPLTFITTPVPTYRLVGIPPGDPCVAGAKYVITGEVQHRWSPELSALHAHAQAALDRHRPPHFTAGGSIAPAMKAWAEALRRLYGHEGYHRILGEPGEGATLEEVQGRLVEVIGRVADECDHATARDALRRVVAEVAGWRFRRATSPGRRMSPRAMPSQEPETP